MYFILLFLGLKKNCRVDIGYYTQVTFLGSRLVLPLQDSIAKDHPTPGTIN